MLVGLAVGVPPGAPVVVALVVVLVLPGTRLGLLLPRRVATWADRQSPAPERWLDLLVLSPVATALVLAVLSV
ncbi:hypothetical protein [Klenkia brasiliensis]|uniref:Uncharacterized protein n=1 Tax=Klenkia brasiliensis TaxID=333142 RepID=A0A1G7XCP2_9ACTN|nr:hypothetical protein [Klenkia brasiliensis]SDG81936.1 hypothetical protein SAMN05660324_3601 [Klenkia brasiliensis]